MKISVFLLEKILVGVISHKIPLKGTDLEC